MHHFYSKEFTNIFLKGKQKKIITQKYGERAFVILGISLF